MPTPFTNVNLDSFFNNNWAPGAAPFSVALKFYQDQLKRNAMGKGLPQLASAKAADPLGPQYQSTPYAPAGAGQQAALQARAQLGKGQANARQTGRSTANSVDQTSLSGATDTSSAFGQSLIDHIRGQLALNQAQAQQAGAGLDSIGSVIGLGTDIASMYFGAPPGAGSAVTGMFSGMNGKSGPFSLGGPTSGSFADPNQMGPFSLLDSNWMSMGAP